MPSFDVVSKVDLHELDNAVDQAKREVSQRYDFKGTETKIDRNDEGITLTSNSEGRLEGAKDVIESKVIRRKLSIKILDAQEPQQAGGQMWKQVVKIRQGVDKEKAKKIVKEIKDSKLKVQASIQGETVRVTGKKRDDLQDVMGMLKEKDFDLPLQFENFRD